MVGLIQVVQQVREKRIWLIKMGYISLSIPKCFKKTRCNEEQGTVCKQARERSMLVSLRSKLRDQAGCGLERSYSCMSFLAFKSVFL